MMMSSRRGRDAVRRNRRGWQSKGAWTQVGEDLKSCQPRQHGRVLCKQMDGLKRGLLAAGWGKD